jgi:hypothetical protein
MLGVASNEGCPFYVVWHDLIRSISDSPLKKKVFLFFVFQLLLLLFRSASSSKRRQKIWNKISRLWLLSDLCAQCYDHDYAHFYFLYFTVLYYTILSSPSTILTSKPRLNPRRSPSTIHMTHNEPTSAICRSPCARLGSSCRPPLLSHSRATNQKQRKKQMGR